MDKIIVIRDSSSNIAKQVLAKLRTEHPKSEVVIYKDITEVPKEDLHFLKSKDEVFPIKKIDIEDIPLQFKPHEFKEHNPFPSPHKSSKGARNGNNNSSQHNDSIQIG